MHIWMIGYTNCRDASSHLTDTQMPHSNRYSINRVIIIHSFRHNYSAVLCDCTCHTANEWLYHESNISHSIPSQNILGRTDPQH